MTATFVLPQETVGQPVTVIGTGWTYDYELGDGVIIWIDSLALEVAVGYPDANGEFSVNFDIPSFAPEGELIISAVGWESADAIYTVTRQQTATCAGISGNYSPNLNRPAQPPGRPKLVSPFQAVNGQVPTVSNGYGGTDTHSDGCYNSYYALDFSLNRQSFPVAAAAGGTLTYLSEDEAGNTVFIDHGNGWKTKYGHLSEDGVTVRGQTIQQGESIQVNAGEVFAHSGSTGASSIHLHFELRATYWPNESQRTFWTTWSYPLYELYGTRAKVYNNIRYTGVSEEFVTEDPDLNSGNNPIGDDVISSIQMPRIPTGDLATQKVVSLYEYPLWGIYSSSNRCEDFRNDDPDLRDNHIGDTLASSIRVGVPCPSAATPKPTRIVAVAISPGSIQLSWLPPSTTTPTGYGIYELEELKAIVRGTINSYTFSGLQAGSNHCYYVIAFYKAGSSTVDGLVCKKTPTS